MNGEMTSKDFFNDREKVVSVKGCLTTNDLRNKYDGYSGEMIGFTGCEGEITEAAFVAGHKKGELWTLLQRHDLRKNNVKKVEAIFDDKMDAFGMKITDNAGRESYISTMPCERTEDFVMLGYFRLACRKAAFVFGMIGAHQPKLVVSLYRTEDFESSFFRYFIRYLMEATAAEEADC